MEIIKRDRSFSKSYDPIVLWLDDLERIFRALHHEKVDITNEEYKFGSLDDLKTHFGGQVIYKLNISGSEPSARLRFDRFTAELYVGAAPNSGQVFYELDELLSKRVRKPRFVNRFWFGTLAGVPGIIGHWWDITVSGVSLSVVAACLFFLIVCRTGYVQFYRYAVIHLQRKHEQKTFLQRNKDQLLMYIITGVVGAFVGFGISQVKDKYMPDWLKLEQKP